jgi:hypothetical protein
MDCEKFEPLLLDELYEELDELTSAAVKRHVSGCSRCAAILSGFKSTRRAISLPLVPLPAGLEDRILAAAKEAQNVIPIRGRFSRALSIAGSWAMRPQTAMAAVFLLMIGSSAVLLRSKNGPSRESAVSVTVAGEPAPTTAPASEALDDKAAASAHGPSAPNITRPPAPPAAAAPAAVAENADDREPQKDKSDYASGSKAGAAAPPPAATMAALERDLGPTQQPAKVLSRAGGEPNDPASLGAAAFRARNYAEAARQYDIAAQGGDLNAELWAAESTREGQGCAAAVGRFERLAQKATGQWVGNEASLRAARCEISLGQLDAARDRLNRLAQIPSHQREAQAALHELDQVATRKAGGATGGAAAPKRSAPAAPKPASQVRAPSEASEKKATDTAAGF